MSASAARPRFRPEIAARIFNAPLLVAEGKAWAIWQGLAPLLGMPLDRWEAIPVDDAPDDPQGQPAGGAAADPQPGIALISISGTLVHRAYGSPPPLSGGLLGYTDIASMLDAAMADPAIGAIALDINSLGGEVSSTLADLAAKIRSAAADKPVWALVDDQACSAAYWIASAADRVVMPAYGCVGSIGTIAVHWDLSEQAKMLGANPTVVKAGARKDDYSPLKPLSPRELAALQADVDRVNDQFVAAVAADGRMTEKTIRGLQAAFFTDGAEAKRLGLIDAIASVPEAVAELAAQITAPKTTTSIPAPGARATATAQGESIMSEMTTPAPSAAPEQTTAPTAAAVTQPTTANVVDFAAAAAAGRADGLKVAEEIIALCDLADHPEMAAGLIAKKASIAEAQTALKEAKAAKRAALGSNVPPAGSAAAANAVDPSASPLVAAAKAHAATLTAMRKGA